MKRNLHITLKVLSGIILTGLLAGCPMPTREDIARNTTEFNLVVENAGNEMLLLNIVRASKRRPMYFTSFGKLSGNLTFEMGTGSINIPFGRIGGGLDGAYSIAPNAGYKYSPLFDVGVLDTKEFINGIMTPVPMETIEYYWSQGWHQEMLLHLFIRRIEIIDRKDKNYPKPVKTYLNYFHYPRDPCDPNEPNFDAFQEQISTKNWNWDIVEVNATSIGDVNNTEASKLQNLVEVQKAGLKLKPCKEDETQKSLSLSQVNYAFTREATEDYKKQVRSRIGEDPNALEIRLLERVNITNSRSGKTKDELEIKVYLRSPEAILYYLGEILRAEMRAEEIIRKERKEITPEDIEEIAPMIHAGFGKCEDCSARLFYARVKRTKDKDPCVFVEYDKTKYVIPRAPDSDMGCCRDRSMHVLSLVSLLIGQYKKSSEIPTTATVSVIGR